MGLFDRQVARCIIACVLLTSFTDLANATQGDISSNQVEPPSSILSYKLDVILDTLEALTTKYDELNKSVQNSCACRQAKSNCQSIPQNYDHDLPEKVNHQSKIGNYSPENSFAGKTWEEPLRKGKGNQSDVGKDLFHINKLASNLPNSIPSSSSPWTAHDEGDLNDWLAEQGNHPAQTQMQSSQASMSRQYERMFGAALENLSSLMKEQLVGFRVTLGKLMNRVVDNSYQYSTISNQLAFIKDECSLAAANTVVSREPRTSDRQSDQQDTAPCQQTNPSAALANQGNVLRTSDMAMMVRLLSAELEHLLADKSRNLEQTSENTHELKVGLKKLDEIDSVVKQSALLLSKLTSGGSQSANQVVITYNNTATVVQGSAVGSGTERPVSTRRWFPGSKVPGRNADDHATQVSGGLGARSTSASNQPGCQSKTSLIRPTSCQHLRLAGANCTGQYYVFVRGSIRHVYCDMNMDSDDEGGGWTVILRRIDKSLEPAGPLVTENPAGPARFARPTNPLLEAFKASQVNFELDWTNYKSGFGQLNEWAEFFIGLDLLHLLTANQTNELQLNLETSTSNRLLLRLDQFSVGDEASQYRLNISESCGLNSSTLCEPLMGLNEGEFYTPDRAVNQTSTSCSPEGLRWWSRQDGGGRGCTSESKFSFTGPIGRQADGRVVHLYWPNWAHSAEPIRQLVLKIRRKRSNGAWV